MGEEITTEILNISVMKFQCQHGSDNRSLKYQKIFSARFRIYDKFFLEVLN